MKTKIKCVSRICLCPTWFYANSSSCVFKRMQDGNAGIFQNTDDIDEPSLPLLQLPAGSLFFVLFSLSQTIWVPKHVIVLASFCIAIPYNQMHTKFSSTSSGPCSPWDNLLELDLEFISYLIVIIPGNQNLSDQWYVKLLILRVWMLRHLSSTWVFLYP